MKSHPDLSLRLQSTGPTNLRLSILTIHGVTQDQDYKEDKVACLGNWLDQNLYLIGIERIIGWFKLEVHLQYALSYKNRVLQPDQINMAAFFWYLGKSDLSNVRYFTCVN